MTQQLTINARITGSGVARICCEQGQSWQAGLRIPYTSNVSTNVMQWSIMRLCEYSINEDDILSSLRALTANFRAGCSRCSLIDYQ